MTAGDQSPEAAQAFGALARCHARFADAASRLGLRPDVLKARRELYLHPLPGGGARVELGVVARVNERGARAGHWQLRAEWAAAGWVVETAAFVAVRGRAADLRAPAQWAGEDAAGFAAAAEQAAAELLADAATANLLSPEPPLVTAARRMAARDDAAPAYLGVPRADWVRAHVLDGATEAEAEARADRLLAPEAAPGGAGDVGLVGIDVLVPLARLGPPLSDALRARLEREVADAREGLSELEALLARVRAITPGAAG